MNLAELLETAYKNLEAKPHPSKKELNRQRFYDKMNRLASRPQPGLVIRHSDRDYEVQNDGSWKRVVGSTGKRGE